MKKKFLVFGLMASSFFAFGQRKKADTYKKQRLSQTDVQVLFSYYTQNGDHSAVTGGIGTENLKVYAPNVTIDHQRDSLNSYNVKAGVDIVTSASADRIDYVMSSASRVDARTHINAGYARRLKHSDTHFGINTGFFIESAYMSIPVGLSFDHISSSKSTEISASLQCFFDDLRWGRLDPDYYHAIRVVYPVELRYKKWFDIYRRNSYNLSFAFYQDINRRMQLAIYPELVYQKGLLSTPYHRVYFNDGVTEKVENFPTERWKFPIGLQLNTFVGNRFIIRSYYRFYHDNFGINANTFKLELPVKISPEWTISPHFRFHTQTAADFFHPYAQHDVNETYYTSDYDLSAFNSYEIGMGIRFAPHASLIHHYSFTDIAFRYGYYKRSDHLAGHILSLMFDIGHSKMKK